MKNKYVTYIIVIFLLLTCPIEYGYSQSTTSGLGNTPGTYFVDFLSWDSSTPIPLDIRTDETAHPQPINFYTDGLWPRMQIYDSLGAPNAGNIAIGYFTALAFGPQSLLHMDQEDNPGNYLQMTNPSTGNVTDHAGFQLGLGPNWGTTAEVRQWSDDSINFYTNNTSVPVPRMNLNRKKSSETIRGTL
jgi:hypothetical protein